MLSVGFPAALLISLPFWHPPKHFLPFIFLGSLGLYFYLSYRIFFRVKPPKAAVYTGDTIESIPRYIKLINEYIDNNGKTFRKNLETIVEYCQKFIRKKELLNKTLLANFSPTELTYVKFNTILNGIENSIANNLNSILVHLHGFDEDEYEQTFKNPASLSSTAVNNRERFQLYKDHIKFVDSSVSFIDGILLKMDKLQFETTKLKTIDYNNIENLESVKDIDHLISTMKYYKI
jgi:hypothetical protein